MSGMLRFTSFYPTLVPQGKIECLESSPVGKPPDSWARTRSWSCTCTPPPARATCLKMSKQTVANLAIVPDDRLVAVDVETLLGRVLDVAEWIVGVGGGSVPVCAVSSFSKIGKEKVYRHCQTKIFISKIIFIGCCLTCLASS